LAWKIKNKSFDDLAKNETIEPLVNEKIQRLDAIFWFEVAYFCQITIED